MSYLIELSEEQAELIKDALDFYTRVVAGQVTEVSQVLRTQRKDLSPADINEIRRLSAEMRRYISTQFNGLPDRAYDILQVIRHKIAWDRNPGGGTDVSFHAPIFKSGEEPIRIEKI